MTYLPTLYKARGVPLKQPVCAICVDRTHGKTRQVMLGYGVGVWLCSDHGSPEFMMQRAGRDFVVTLQRLWQACGCLTGPRHRALSAHLASLRPKVPSGRRRPGSYAWPSLRREAESAFRSGCAPASTIHALRTRHLGGPATVPSAFTMWRWYRERRWLAPERASPRTIQGCS